MLTESKRAISALDNGTVLDHIPAGKARLLIQVLKLEGMNCRMSVGFNLPSARGGNKDLIKVEGWSLTKAQASKIALFAPDITINIIEEGKVIEKFQAELPNEVENLISCPNTKCITNSEKSRRHFTLRQVGKKIFLRCSYCEKRYAHDEMVEL